MSQLRSVWNMYLRAQIQEQNIPAPGLSQDKIESLSALELEQYALRALRLRKNWTSRAPVTSSRLEVRALPMSRIVALEFLPGKEHRWLISVALTVNTTRKFTFQCWDLHPAQPVCIAVKQFQRLRSFVVNRNASGSGHLAVQHMG